VLESIEDYDLGLEFVSGMSILGLHHPDTSFIASHLIYPLLEKKILYAFEHIEAYLMAIARK